MPSTQMMSQLSDNLVYSAIAVYLLAMLAYAALSARRTGSAAIASSAPAQAVGVGAVGAARSADAAPHPMPADAERGVPTSGDRLAASAAALTILGFGLHAGGVVARGLAAERVPWGNMYEFAVVAALTAAATFLVFLWREPVRAFGVWVTAVVALTLGLAVTVLYTPTGALVPVLNSYWLVIHVAAAITAGGVFTLSFIATVLYRVKLRSERSVRGQGARYAGSLPTSATLNRIAHTAVLFAFPIWTFAVIAGAIWAENSWGRYWGWDPKETWAFITWVMYAGYLHAEATAGWRGTKASWFALLGYAAFVFNFFGVNMWITGLHSYAGI